MQVFPGSSPTFKASVKGKDQGQAGWDSPRERASTARAAASPPNRHTSLLPSSVPSHVFPYKLQQAVTKWPGPALG